MKKYNSSLLRGFAMLHQLLKNVPEGYRVVPITTSVPFWESFIVKRHGLFAVYLSPEWDEKIELIFHKESEVEVIPRIRWGH